MSDEHLDALHAVSEELALLKDELREARSGGDEGFLKRVAALSSSLDALSRRLAELEESRISELSSLRADVRSLRGDLSKITYSADSVFSAKLAGLEEKIGAFGQALSTASAASQLQLSEAGDLKEELSSVRESVSSLRDETKAASENSRSLAQKLDGLASSAKSSITADVQALCMEIKGLSSSSAAHSHDIAKMSSRLESIERASQKISALSESYNSNSAAIRDMEAKLSSVLSALSSQRNELSAESSRARQFEELALSLQNELSAFSKELEANARALESVGASMALLKQSNEGAAAQLLGPRLDSISQSLALANETLSSVSSQLSGATPLIKSLDSAGSSLSREASRMQAAYSALQEKMSRAAPAKPHDFSSIGFQLEQLTSEVRQLQKTAAKQPAEKQTTSNDNKLAEELGLLRKQIDSLSSQLGEVKGDSATDLSKAFSPILKELHALSARMSAMQPAQQLDFSPIMEKLEEIKSMRFAVPDEAFAKPVLQKVVFEELQQEIRRFEGFDLSDRAKLVVGRLNSLAAKGLALSTQ